VLSFAVFLVGFTLLVAAIAVAAVGDVHGLSVSPARLGLARFSYLHNGGVCVLYGGGVCAAQH
jgi:hypothetical protein